MNRPDARNAILKTVMIEAQSLTQDWGRAFADPIAPETRLIADLGCQSLDIIVLTANVSRQLHRTDIPFERLLVSDGRPVSDISLGTLADFIWEQTAGAAGESVGGEIQ
jgi:acyl carrier protein